MAKPSVELRPTIDRGWLEEAARSDPVTHAYAVWDLARAPGRIRIVSAVVGGRTFGYLLFWLGHPSAIVVHWVGSDPATEELVRALPPPPFVVTVPPSARDAVLRARGAGREFPLRVLVREPGPGAVRAAPTAGVRRLSRADRPTIVAWATRQADPAVAEYVGLDPEAEPTWAAFDGGRPVGVARAAVRLPSVWVVGGVYVEPSARRRGWGRGLVAAVSSAAEAAGARSVLYVREDRGPALRLYEGLGFAFVQRRIWIDVGTGLAP